MTETVALVHGISNWPWRDPALWGCAPVLRARGYSVELVGYGFSGPVSARARMRAVIGRLAEIAPDHVIGHSHGGAIAMEYGEDHTVDALVLVQPAVRRDAGVPRKAGRVLCLHNKGDWAVRIGGVSRLANPVNVLHRHPWGDAGRVGLDEADGVTNWDTEGDVAFPVSGHAGPLIGGSEQAYWTHRIADYLKEGVCTG